DHDRDLAAQRGQPAAVPLGGAELGGERHVPPLAQALQERRVDRGHVPPVGDDDHGAPSGRRGGAGGHRDRLRPARAGQRGPDRPRRGAPVQRPQERLPGGVVPPRPGRDRQRRLAGAGGRRAGLGLADRDDRRSAGLLAVLVLLLPGSGGLRRPGAFSGGGGGAVRPVRAGPSGGLGHFGGGEDRGGAVLRAGGLRGAVLPAPARG